MPALTWQSILDPKRTCQTCFDLHDTTASVEFWELTGEPGIRDTECGNHCLCMLIDPTWTEGKLQEEITRAIDEGFDELVMELTKGIKIDITKGGFSRDPIILKEFSDIKGFGTLPLSVIKEHQKLIIKWKRGNGFRALPDEFLQLADIEKQIKWLGARL